MGKADLDKSFKLSPQKKPTVLRRNISHSFSTVSGGRPPSLSKSNEKAEWPHCTSTTPHGDMDGSSKRISSYIFNMMASKKSATERQTSVQPSQHICQEHQVSVIHHRKRKTKVHVGDIGEYREYGKPHRVFSAAPDFVAHSDPMDVDGMICKNTTGPWPSQRSQFRISFVSDFSDEETLYESKIENEEGQFRLSFVSDLSEASGLSGMKNYESDNEDDTSNEAQQEHADTACQVRYSFFAAFSDGSALNDHKKRGTTSISPSASVIEFLSY